MARITLDGIAHAYGGKPRSEDDYALKPLHHVWEQGMAYALIAGLPKNLRSGFLQEDVEDYLYELLPARDAVLTEMENYASEHEVPIIGPAVARVGAVAVR